MGPMHRCLSSLVLLALLAAGATARGDETEPGDLPRLEDGIPRAVELSRGEATWTGRVEVPEGATSLVVAACADRDLDVYLKRGRPVGTDRTQADAFSRGDGLQEIVRVGPAKGRPLGGATWFVTVVHDGHGLGGAGAEVVAFVDDKRIQTIVPGNGSHPLGAVDGTVRLRTFLPTDARSLVLEIKGAESDAIRLDLEGPRGHARRGRGVGKIVLDRDESPPGVYTVDLEAAGEAALPDGLRAQVTWEYPEGRALPPLPQPLVRLGSALTLTLGGPDHSASRMIRIPVPKGTPGFTIDATNDREADVDLYVRRGQPLKLGDQDADYFALTCATKERIVVGGVNALEGGIYFCELLLVSSKDPVKVRVRVQGLRAKAGLATWGRRPPPPLRPGVWVKGRVQACVAGLRWYGVTAPRGTRSIHAVVLDATAPLDLVLARRTNGSIMHRSLSARVDESLGFTFRTPLPGPRHFQLAVMNRNPYEQEVDYRIAISFDGPPKLPKDYRWPPVMETDKASPIAKVAAATVELTVRGNSGGSGTCISPKGHILTCRHVLEVEDDRGRIQRDGILVAFPSSLQMPPVQAFVARVIREDKRRDLALLELQRDVFGRPLPADLALPTVALGDASKLQLGDAVSVFGYPSEGSERSRTPVIVTRGTVAGLEGTRDALHWIKTDAWIGLGHSGGTLVDRSFRLVGVPAATLGNREVLGLAVPVSRVPASWLAAIR